MEKDKISDQPMGEMKNPHACLQTFIYEIIKGEKIYDMSSYKNKQPPSKNQQENCGYAEVFFFFEKMKTIFCSKSKVKIKDVTKIVLRSYDYVNCSENTPPILKNEDTAFPHVVTSIFVSCG